jgi:soluble lytic murein transglycosylase-like protein
MAAGLIRSIAMLGSLFLVQLSIASSYQSPPPAYRAAAAAKGIPPNVLFAVALAESGTNLKGRFIPWPWTLGLAGHPHRYSTRAEACVALLRALRELAPIHIDIGLGQINFRYHGHRVKQPCALLDPHLNLSIAAAILSEHHTPGNDWLIAIGRYHRPAGGETAARYRHRVQQHLARLPAGSSPTTTP